MTPSWQRSMQDGLDTFPDNVDRLWVANVIRNGDGNLEPVFGTGEEWYFWDEAWMDAYGPFPSKQEAEMNCAAYAKTL